jgi:hypothetical protein
MIITDGPCGPKGVQGLRGMVGPAGSTGSPHHYGVITGNTTCISGSGSLVITGGLTYGTLDSSGKLPMSYLPGSGTRCSYCKCLHEEGSHCKSCGAPK